MSRASTTPSQKTATKRSQSTPNITSKRARAEEVVRSAVARDAPPPAFSQVRARPTSTLSTAATSPGLVCLASKANDSTVTRASEQPQGIPKPTGMCKPSDTASESTGMPESVGDFSVDEDHLSIAVGPLESLEATACAPPPREPSVAAETTPAEELYEQDSHQKNSSQTSREMDYPDNPPPEQW